MEYGSQRGHFAETASGSDATSVVRGAQYPREVSVRVEPSPAHLFADFWRIMIPKKAHEVSILPFLAHVYD